MFTRNEKPASPASGAKTQTPEKVEPPATT